MQNAHWSNISLGDAPRTKAARPVLFVRSVNEQADQCTCYTRHEGVIPVKLNLQRRRPKSMRKHQSKARSSNSQELAQDSDTRGAQRVTSTRIYLQIHVFHNKPDNNQYWWDSHKNLLTDSQSQCRCQRSKLRCSSVAPHFNSTSSEVASQVRRNDNPIQTATQWIFGGVRDRDSLPGLPPRRYKFTLLYAAFGISAIPTNSQPCPTTRCGVATLAVGYQIPL